MGLRQEKFSKQIQRDLGEIFQLHRHDWLSGEFITISGVQSSPDLGYVKVYVSLYNAAQKQRVMENLDLFGREIRMELARRLKNTVKKIPELSFFEDDTLDYMNKMDKIFKEIHKNDPSSDSDLTE